MFKVIGSTGDVLQKVDSFDGVDWFSLVGMTRWEIWTGSQCLAQVDTSGQACPLFVIRTVADAIRDALHTLPHYEGRVVIRVGECFRPTPPPQEIYTVRGEKHDPKEVCTTCWAKGWGPLARCPCCGAEKL